MKPEAKTATQTLLDERSRLAAQMDALENKIRGLDLAIELLNAGARPQESLPSQRGRGISETIRTLLKEAGDEGLTVQQTIELAAQRGQDVNKTSVSSLLSRMKRAGEVAYRRKKYSLR
jgi:hypothetical protein